MEINTINPNAVDAVRRRQTTAGDTRSAPHETDASPAPEVKLTPENVRNLADTLNAAARSVNERISFSYNEKVNRVIMRVTDSSSLEVIRELPSQDMVRLLERIHEMIGMFVDASR